MFGFGLGGIGPTGWIVIGVAILLLVGTRGQIPQLMRDLGRGINSFRSGLKEGEDEGKTPKAAVEEKAEDTVDITAKATDKTDKKA